MPESPRMYKNKAKNAQEAHECIRPTDMAAGPESLKLAEADQRKLYDLIWKRTIASQMAAARMERTAVDVTSPDGQVGLRANGQVVLFDGFLKVYDEGRDEEEDDEGRLPQIMQGEGATKKAITPEQHFTQAPPRYSEATLVKRMEELGIGRPSTYASVSDHDPGPRICPQGKEPPDPRGQGAAGDGVPDQLFPPLCRV